jgi:hypothetical protein
VVELVAVVTEEEEEGSMDIICRGLRELTRSGRSDKVAIRL